MADEGRTEEEQAEVNKLLKDYQDRQPAPKAVKAKVAQRGPYAIEVEAGKQYYYCTCGHSRSQPFCDGSHNAVNSEHGTEFKPTKYEAETTDTVYFCGCRRTDNGIFCDGTHNRLPELPSAETPAADFAAYTVRDVAPESPDTVRMTVAGSGGAVAAAADAGAVHHFSLRLPSEEASRPYTPVAYDAAKNELQLLVKRVEGGAVSPAVHGVQAGDVIELAGPMPGSYSVAQAKPRSLLLLAAGSGVTPIYQALRSACALEEKPEVVVVCSHRTREDLLLRRELEALREQHADVVKDVVFCVTGEESAELEDGLHKGRVSADLLRKVFRSAELATAHALICGPPGFNEACAKACTELGFDKASVTLC